MTALSLSALVAVLAVLLWRQQAEIVRLRRRLTRMANIAECYQRAGKLYEITALTWRDRARHPELAPYWQAIEAAVKDET